MAVSLRELFLIVRAEDHASKQLRMVSGSLRGLSRATDVAAKSAQLQGRAMAMQTALAQKQAKIATFPAQEEMQQKRRMLLQNDLLASEQALSNHRANADREAEKLSQRTLGRAEKQVKALTKVAQAEGLRGAALQSTVRRQAAPIMAGAQADMAAGANKAALAEERLQIAVQKATVSIEAQNIAMRQQKSAHAAFAAGAAVDAERLATFNREVAKFNDQAPKLARAERIGRMGTAAAGIGRTAMFTGGVAAAGLGFAAAGAAKLSTQTTLAATQAVTKIEQVGRKAQQVQKGILDQMAQFPASADEMSKSIYDIFSGTNVQRANKGLQLMALFNKAAVAGQSDLNTATQGGITVMNAYNKQVRDMPGIMQKMFSAVRFGRTNFTDFNNSLNQLVPAFKSANQSINVMFGSLAFLTRRMPSVRMASTSLARATEILGNDKMIKGLHKVGVEIADVHGQLKPLPQVIGLILQKFPQLAKGKNVMTWIKDMSNQQGTIQARRALTFLFRQFPQYQQMLQQVTGDTNEFTRSYRALAKTPGVRLNVAINQLKAMGLTIGADAIPAIVRLIKPLQSAVQWFDKLSPATKSNVSTFLVFGAAITLVGGALLTFLGNAARGYATLRELMIVQNVGGAFLKFGSAIRFAGAALAAGEFGLFAAQIAAIGPALPIALLLAAGAAMIYFSDSITPIPKQIDNLTASLDNVKDPLKNLGAFNKIMRTTQHLSSQVAGHISTAQSALAGGGEGTKGRGAMMLHQQIHDSGESMKRLNVLTSREADLLARAAESARETNQHLNKQQLSVGGAGLAASAGLTAAQQSRVGFISRMAGELPSPKLLARFQEFGDKAIDIAATVADATGKMIGGKQLDQALSLGQKKLMRLFGFVQKHHKLPKWFLEVDAKRAIRDTGKVTRIAQKLGRKHFKVTFQDGSGPARKGITKATRDAIALNNKRFKVHVTADTAAVSAGLSHMSDTAFAMGARTAAQFNAGFKAAAKIGSPSKVMEKNGKMLIRGLSEGIVKEAGGVKAAFKSIIDTMSSMWTGLHDQMQSSFGTLFQGPRGDIISTIAGFGAKPGIGLLTQDLRAQTHKFSTWMHAVDRLRSMGAPPSLVSQLWELGPDSLPMVQSILSGTKKQRRQYFGLARRENRLITSATQRAFLNQTRIWKNMGKQMAFGILTGLRDVRPELLKFFKQLAHEMFHTFKKHNKSHSPSRLYYEEGRNIMLGLQLGMNSVRPSIPGMGGVGSSRGVGAHTHYHYHAPAYQAGTSESSWAKKSRFDFERHIGKLPR